MSQYETLTLERLREMIADHLALDTADIRPSARLCDLGADSLDMIELFIWIEDDYDVTLPEDINLASSTVTVQQLLDGYNRALRLAGR